MTSVSASTHKHADGTCPITGASGSNPHAFCPPQDGDVRAPCPALNTMANHGYLPRDGKALTAPMIRQALVECYGLSKTLAFLLTNGALLLLNQGRGNFQLSDFARHNKIEHNASLYHLDAGPRDEYSPIHGDPGLLDLLFKDSASGVVMTPEDIARVRVRRQLTSSIPTFYAEVARGEIAIVLNMFNNPDADLHERQHVPLQPQGLLARFWGWLTGAKRDPATTPLDGVPIDRLRYWFEHERLPEGWRPYHATTVRQTMTTISRIRAKMIALEIQNSTDGKVPKKNGIDVEPFPVEGRDNADSLSESDDEKTPHGPTLHHSSSISTLSSTSSAPSDALHTPEASQFLPAAASKDEKTPKHSLRDESIS